MDKIAFFGVLVINSVILIRNTVLIIKQKIEPSLAMWLFLPLLLLDLS